MEQVTVHEFSTGIVPEIFADGTWQSRGFTAQFMNVTIDPIPYGVRRAIANKLFAVVEGTETTDPAIIGREVYDQNTEKWWSVVALVNQGRDEKGRPISVTRYFLTEEKGNLWKILAWMDQYQKAEGRFPVFNPSEAKTIGNPTIVKVEHPSDIKEMPPNLGNQIVVKVDDKYNLQDINKAAENRVAGNKPVSLDGYPVSWAFNVEALEASGNFALIQAANLTALKSIKDAFNSIQAFVPITFDEQRVRTAIKTLMNSSTVNETAVQIIAHEMSNKQVTEQNWDKLFNGEGANKAISNKIHSSQLARLLTLRAFVLPITVIDLYKWLCLKPSAANSSLEFQQNFTKAFRDKETIKEKIKDGIVNLLYQLYKGDLNEDQVKEFLEKYSRYSSENSWYKYLTINKKERGRSIKDKYQDNCLYELLSTIEATLKEKQEWEKFKNCLANENELSKEMLLPLLEYIEKNYREKNKPIQQPPDTNHNFINTSGNKPVNTKESLISRIPGNIPTDKLNQAVSEYEKTLKSLKNLAIDIYNIIQGHILNDIDSKFDDNKINKINQTIVNILFPLPKIKILLLLLKIDNNKLVQFIFESKFELDVEKKKQLAKAVYRYQNQNKHQLDSNSNGIIELEDSEGKTSQILELLKRVVIYKLRSEAEGKIFESEISKARDNFETTRSLLQNIIKQDETEEQAETKFEQSPDNVTDETTVDKKNDKKDIFKLILKALESDVNSRDKLNPSDVQDIINQDIPVSGIDDTFKNKWIKVIASYQFNKFQDHLPKGEEYGILREEGDTYKSLSEVVLTSIDTKL